MAGDKGSVSLARSGPGDGLTGLRSGQRSSPHRVPATGSAARLLRRRPARPRSTMRRLLALPLLAAATLALASCGDAETDSGGDGGGSAAATPSAPRPTRPTTCSPRSATSGVLTRLDRPGVPAAVEVHPQGGQVRRLRHRRRHGDRQPARRRRSPGRRRRWDVITAGSWNGRWDMSVGLDDPDERPAGGARLHRAVLLHARRGVVHEDNTSVSDLTTDLDGKTIGVVQPAAPTSSSSTRPWTSRASTSTSSSTTPRSRATTPTPPRCRTSRSVTAPASTP